MAERKIPRRDVPEALRVAAGSRFRLRDADADRTLGWERDKVDTATAENLLRLGELQYKMYADARFAMLVVIQGIDGGGKDSTIRRVMSTFNPQGFTVTAFKAPSVEELRHDYLWRIHSHVPPRGEVAVFNRSHYEDVLVVRVDNLVPEAVWSRRYEQINRFELNLHECTTRIVKIFLHISRDEQKRRLEERLAVRSKQWKFSTEDLAKRAQWDDYRQAFEAAITRCTSVHAPWYVVPANRKWFRDFAVSQILLQQFEQLPLRWPRPHYDAKTIRID
jgi:PPK2 family polyphosphate:nucleotide phosphotransferase